MKIKLLQPAALLLMAQSPTPFISMICSIKVAVYLPSDFYYYFFLVYTCFYRARGERSNRQELKYQLPYLPHQHSFTFSNHLPDSADQILLIRALLGSLDLE